MVMAALLAAGVRSSAAQSSTANRLSIKQPPVGEPAARARGRIVFRDRCTICHYSDSTAQKIGPGLKRLYGRGKFTNGAKADDASVENWILNGSKNMPPFKGALTPVQMRDLLAYLKSI
jgi:mono/diheme cytochrome c family protein